MSKKRKEKLNMNNLMPIDLNAKQSAPTDELEIKDFSFDKEYADKVLKHNFDIRNFGEDYINFSPNGYSMIVRPYCKEISISPEGVVTPNREVIGIPTKAGAGGASHYEVITDPFGFSRKCVVVSVSDEPTMQAKYKINDTVYLSNVIKPMPMGRGGDVTVHIPQMFVHPVSGPDVPPTDPTDDHFGYLLIYEQDVQGTDRRDNK